MPIPQKEMPLPKAVSFEELYSAIGGGTAFTLDDLVLQLSYCHDEKKDFRIFHRSEYFIVPLAKIQEYFETHKKPEKPMDLEQQNKILRQRIEEAEREIQRIKGASKTEEVLELDDKEETVPQKQKGLPQRQSLEEIQKELKEQLKDQKPVARPRGRRKKESISETL